MNENLAKFLAGLPASVNGNAGVIAGGDGRPAFVRIDDSAIRSFIPASRSGFGGLTGLVGGAPGAAENFSNAANSILAGAGESIARFRARGRTG